MALVENVLVVVEVTQVKPTRAGGVPPCAYHQSRTHANRQPPALNYTPPLKTAFDFDLSWVENRCVDFLSFSGEGSPPKQGRFKGGSLRWHVRGEKKPRRCYQHPGAMFGSPINLRSHKVPI